MDEKVTPSCGDIYKDLGVEPPRMMPATFPAVSCFLDQYVLNSFPDAYYSYPLSIFENEWITKDMVRAVMRKLRDRGFVDYNRSLFDDDGKVAGSGYQLTKAGVLYLANLQTGTPQ